ncbi:unnamed protein product, partial [Echinostoma caproni]|uniref:SPOC domain-containing protein n=1 Tax=Echinostoma caproni TaxID=27848 RepID=A0A183BGD1_9TREM
VGDTDNTSVECQSDPTESANSEKTKKKSYEKSYPLQALIAYLKLKQAVALVVPTQPDKDGSIQTGENVPPVDSTPHRILLFAPSSFALSLLKQAAPNLGPELATMDKYMVMLIVKR